MNENLRMVLFFQLQFILLLSGINPAYPQNSGGDVNIVASSNEDSATSGCVDRLADFVKEIDGKIEASSSVDPLLETLNRFFPLSGCNIEEAISVAKTSKYFEGVTEYPKTVVIVLRGGNSGKWGFKVSFGLNKDTGSSVLPNAAVDIQKRGDK